MGSYDQEEWEIYYQQTMDRVLTEDQKNEVTSNPPTLDFEILAIHKPDGTWRTFSLLRHHVPVPIDIDNGPQQAAPTLVETQPLLRGRGDNSVSGWRQCLPLKRGEGSNSRSMRELMLGVAYFNQRWGRRGV